jgi:hypothetical protein
MKWLGKLVAVVLVVVSVLWALAAAVFWAMGSGDNCKDYTQDQATKVVGDRLDTIRKLKWWKDSERADINLCKKQPTLPRIDETFPFIVEICLMTSGDRVAYGEVYSDCGIEWRFRGNYQPPQSQGN